MAYHLHSKTSVTRSLACLAICLYVVVPARAEFGDLVYTFADANNTGYDAFGWDVAISESTAVVGSSHIFFSTFPVPQNVHVFDLSTGVERYKLENSQVTATAGFGYSVAIDGNVLIAGAGERTTKGEAHLFDALTGQQLRYITGADTVARDDFGESVDIHGNKAIVGAFANRHAGELSGAAYVFDVATGQQLYKLTAPDAARQDQFGNAVGISGNFSIVGAPNQFAEQNKPGAAYLFHLTRGLSVRKLSASDPSTNDNFGQSVAIDGNIAIIGAPFSGSPSNPTGYAYVFDVTTGQQLFKLAPSDGANGDAFGRSVDISGHTAIVGAPVANDGFGAVYLFDVTTGQELLKITAPDPAPVRGFGRSIAIDGNRAIVGAMPGFNSRGAAYVFDITRLPGDFNNDGTVDAADYVVWRNGLGTTYTQVDYNAWRANFGRSAAGAVSATAGVPSSANPAVPEPTAGVSLAIAAISLVVASSRFFGQAPSGILLRTD
jgi:hypothetical protein